MKTDPMFLLAMVLSAAILVLMGGCASESLKTTPATTPIQTVPKCNGIQCIQGRKAAIVGEDLFAIRVLQYNQTTRQVEYARVNVPEGSILYIFPGVQE